LRDGSTHHHGPLAGVSAGAAVVLFAVVVLLLAWHRVAGQVSTGITVLVYVVIAAIGFAALAAAAHVVLRLYHQAAMWQHERARSAAAGPAVPQAAEIPAVHPAAIEPPRVYLNVTQDQLAALMRQHAEE
jgi:multisubunit Na+/H+ antiporter MnhG subunit